MEHLTSRVDTGIGSAGSGDIGLLSADIMQSCFNVFLNGKSELLRLPSVICPADICDGAFQADHFTILSQIMPARSALAQNSII